MSWLPALSLFGPTHYEKVIQEINVKQVDHELFYKVLVIITDGEPADLQATIDQIVVSSHKPVSIILVSVTHQIQDMAHYNQIQ